MENPLIAAYKTFRELSEADFPEGIDPEWAARECEEICNGILRLAHELGGFGECVGWDAGRSQFPSTLPAVK